MAFVIETGLLSHHWSQQYGRHHQGRLEFTIDEEEHLSQLTDNIYQSLVKRTPLRALPRFTIVGPVRVRVAPNNEYAVVDGCLLSCFRDIVSISGIASQTLESEAIDVFLDTRKLQTGKSALIINASLADQIYEKLDPPNHFENIPVPNAA
eukprot:769008_1